MDTRHPVRITYHNHIELRGQQVHYIIYKDAIGEWRWRLRGRNGRIIADSGEGYRRRRDCRAGIRLMRKAVAAVVLVH